jgi:hypothetical protein
MSTYTAASTTLAVCVEHDRPVTASSVMGKLRIRHTDGLLDDCNSKMFTLITVEHAPRQLLAHALART